MSNDEFAKFLQVILGSYDEIVKQLNQSDTLGDIVAASDPDRLGRIVRSNLARIEDIFGSAMNQRAAERLNRIKHRSEELLVEMAEHWKFLSEENLNGILRWSWISMTSAETATGTALGTTQLHLELGLSLVG